MCVYVSRCAQAAMINRNICNLRALQHNTNSSYNTEVILCIFYLIYAFAVYVKPIACKFDLLDVSSVL